MAQDDLMSQKILITGCTGEVGARLTHHLLNLNYEVFGIRGSRKCNIIDSRHTCRKANLLSESESLNFADIKPDILVHTAWLTTPNEFWKSDQNSEWLIASKRMISEFMQSGGRYLVVTGSCAEYSWESKRELNENSLEAPSSPYGEAKLELLNWIRTTDLKFLWTRTFFQFGSKEANGRLIPSLIDALLKGDRFIVQNGSFVRDFVYIEDVAKILETLISLEINGIVNIGQGKGLKLEELTRSIAKMIGREELIQIRPNNLNPSYVVSDSTKLNGLVKNFSWTALDSALMESIISRKASSFDLKKSNR